MTPSIQWESGTQRIPPRTSKYGTNRLLYSTYPMNPNYMIPLCPTWEEVPWSYQELASGYYVLIYPQDLEPSPSLPDDSLRPHDHPTPGPPLIPIPAPTRVTLPKKDKETTPTTSPSHSKAHMTPLTPGDSTMSGQNSLMLTKQHSAPTELPPGNSGGKMSNPKWIGSPEPIENTWTSSLRLIKEMNSWEDTLMPRSQPGSLPTETRSYTPPFQANRSKIYTPERRKSRGSWNGPYTPLHYYRETALTWTVPPTNPFDGFQYDEEMFGQGFELSQVAEEMYNLLEPLPDSPPNPRYHGYYTGPRTSILIARAGDASGSEMQEDMPQPSTEDRLQQALMQMELMRQEAIQLREELDQMKKGKGVDRDNHPTAHDWIDF